MFQSPISRGGDARPPRILTPIHSFEPGGVERVALRLNDAWRRLGARAQLVVGRAEGPLQDELPCSDCDVLQQGTFSTGPIETLWMIAKLPGRIRRFRPDLLFCPGNSYAVIGVAMKLLLGKNCPPVLLKISNDLVRLDLPRPVRFFYRLWLLLQGRSIDRFVAIAEPMRDEIVRLMGVDRDRVDVVEDASVSLAEIERIARARKAALARDPAPGRRFLAVGRLAPQKNFELLIRAFALIARPEDRLTMVGEGPERPALERLACKLGIASQLELPGHVQPIDPYLAHADTFVMSSDYEGVPAALIEALAAGLPVIATDCCISMPALLDHGALGRLVPVEDEGALSAAMDSTIPSAPLHARRRAERFTVERAAEAYLGVIERAEYVNKPIVPAPRCGFGAPVPLPAEGKRAAIRVSA